MLQEYIRLYNNKNGNEYAILMNELQEVIYIIPLNIKEDITRVDESNDLYLIANDLLSEDGYIEFKDDEIRQNFKEDLEMNIDDARSIEGYQNVYKALIDTYDTLTKGEKTW